MSSILKRQSSNCKNGVDLWLCRLEQVSAQQVGACQALLNESELARLQRFRSDKKARAYTVAHGLLRQVLSLYHPVNQPKDWQFLVGEHGKPHITSEPHLYFNLSHCDDAVALVITKHAEAGVDVESYGRKHDTQGIIERYFHVSEQEYLFSLSAKEQKKAFYQYWTLKEAYSKGTSLGLAHTLDTFSVNLSDKAYIKSSADQDWQFVLYTPDQSLVLSAAVNMPSSKAHWQIFEYIPFSGQPKHITDLGLMRISA